MNAILRAVDNVMAVVVALLLFGLVVGLLALVVWSVLHMTVQNWLTIGLIVLGIGIWRGMKRLGEFMNGLSE